MRLAVFLLILCFKPALKADAQSLSSSWLEHIEANVCIGDSFCPKGLFITSRSSLLGLVNRDENNIFYPALIAYTLKSISPFLNERDRNKALTIASEVPKSFEQYKNRKGGITYNYYRTHPEDYLPNGNFYLKKQKFALPDDADDTVIPYLCMNTSDSLNEALHKYMSGFIYSENKKLKNIPRKYRRNGAYFTWFAQKLKQDQDICVLSNILLFAFEKKIKLNEADFHTIQLIKTMVMNNEHLKHPAICSPYYRTSPIILYHLARTISVSKDSTLNSLRPKIISDLRAQLKQRSSATEQMILIISLCRLGEKPEFFPDDKKIENDLKKFCWFRGSINRSFSMFWIRLTENSRLLQRKYKNEAYSYALYGEYKVWTRIAIEKGR